MVGTLELHHAREHALILLAPLTLSLLLIHSLHMSPAPACACPSPASAPACCTQDMMQQWQAMMGMHMPMAGLPGMPPAMAAPPMPLLAPKPNAVQVRLALPCQP